MKKFRAMEKRGGEGLSKGRHLDGDEEETRQ